jgi:hypothetical protein
MDLPVAHLSAGGRELFWASPIVCLHNALQISLFQTLTTAAPAAVNVWTAVEIEIAAAIQVRQSSWVKLVILLL